MNFDDTIVPDGASEEEALPVTREETGWDIFEEEDPNGPDLTKVQTMLLSSDWIEGDIHSRPEMADNAFSLIADTLEQSVGKKVRMPVFRNGQKVFEEVEVHDAYGKLNKQGRDYLEQARRALGVAASHPDGAVVVDGFTGEAQAAPWLSDFMSSRPEQGEDLFPQVDEWMNEETALDSEDFKAGLTWDKYVNFLKADGNGTPFDPGDKDLQEEFYKHLKRSTYDTSLMDENQVIDVVEGSPVINPANLFEIDKVEAGIENLKGFSKAAKRMMLLDYREQIEQKIVDGARVFSAADAGPVEAVFNRPLMQELEAHLQTGKPAIDFLRANKERFSRDSYGKASEVAATLRDAVAATGTGATWLAGAAVGKIAGLDGLGEMAGRPAEIWGALAEESAAAYRNPTAFNVGSIDIKRRDLTELLGQVGSFIAIGGAANLATRSVGLTAAREALAAGSAGTGAMARVASGEAALARGVVASEAQLSKVVGEKTAKFLTAAGTDTTAYLGGVQASGMSFGKTYNQVLEQTGDADAAYKAASIQGVSDGLSALIATGVMNRVAPGMERLLGGSGKVEGSLIQSIKAARASTAGKAGMLQAKEALESLTPELRKQFVKDVAASVRKGSSAAGLRSFGAVKDVFAEGVEEGLDEALSDVLQVVLDDSKSWSEGDWGNIHDNFRDYMKAAVLGALGGGAGVSVSTAANAFGQPKIDRKKAIEQAVSEPWKLIKANVEKFSNHDQLVSLGTEAKVVKLSEMLASDKLSTKEKSDALVSLALQGSVRDAAELSVDEPANTLNEPGDPAPAPVEDDGTLSVDPEDAETGEKLSQMGFKPPAGTEWKKGLKTVEAPGFRVASDSASETKLYPVSVGDDSYVGARLETTDKKTGAVTSRHVGQDEAIDLISKAGFGTEARRGNHAALFQQARETQTKNDGTNASEAIESGWTSPVSKSVESKRNQAGTTGSTTTKPAEGSATKTGEPVPADAEVPVEERQGDGDNEAAGTGSNDEADRDGGTEPGGSEPAVPEAQSGSVAPKPSAADKTNLKALGKVSPEDSGGPSPDARYVVRKEQVKGKEDKNGGRWLIDGSNYTYVPAKGKTLKLTVQDVLLIEGEPDEVLVLHNIQGGQLNFMKVNTGGLGINMQESAETKLLQDRWSATRLDKAANALAPLLQTLMKGNLDKKDLAAFKKAFELVVGTVAPGARPVYSVLKARAGDGHFMQANAQADESGGVSLVMQVDLERTAKVLRTYLGEASPSNPDYQRVISLEAARLLSKWVDEEQIHILTMDPKHFSVEEMENFYREVLAETKSPFHRYLLDTVRERFPSIDMNGEWQEAVKAETNGEYIVGSELLRKLFQVMMTGSYSEEAANDARRLSQALNGDTAKGGFMRTLAELLRRYTKRIAELLHFKAIQGKLPDSQHELLARLKRVYTEANLNGDVDLVKGKGKLAVNTRLRTLSASNKLETNKISKLHSNALLQLRDLAKDFTSIAPDDYVVVSDDMELGLHPDIREHIQRNPDRFDLKAIEDALEALNAEESYQKAWSEMYIAYQGLQMATEDLTFNPLELFGKGKEFDKSGVMALILAGAPKTTGDNALVRAARAKLKEVRGKQKLLKKSIEFETVARIGNIDTGKASGRKELIKRASALGWDLREMKDRADFQGFNFYAGLKERVARGTSLRMRNAPVYLETMAVSEDPDVSGWVDLKALNEQEQELKGLLAEIEEASAPEEASNQTVQNRTVFGNEGAERVGSQLRRSMAGVDMEVARERYRQFEEWQKALEEFNARASNVKRRAIGDFQDYFSKDFGLAFQDTRFTAVSGMETRPEFGPRVDPVEEARTASDALGYQFIPAKSAKGLLPGEGRPRNPGKEHSTLEAVEMVEAHSRAINSNAAFIGRKGWSDYFLAKSLGQLPGDFDHVKYMAGAGFSFFGDLNQYDRMEFESADSAFPSFGGFDELFGMQRRLEADEPLTQDKLNGFISYIQKARDWVDGIRERIDPERMILEMNGKQTPAARLALLLNPVLDELTNYLDQNAATFATALVGHVYYDSTKPFGDAFARNEDGSLKLKPAASGQTSLDVVYASLKESLDPNAKTSVFAYMVEAQLAASTAVKLTAKTVREFNNKRHRDNVEQEAVRTIRDLAYTPDNPDLLALRDSFIDLPTHRNMLFQLGYQEKDNDYHVTSLHAFELLENYRKINRGSREAYLTAKSKQGRQKTFEKVGEPDKDGLFDYVETVGQTQLPQSQIGLPIVDQTALVQTYDNRGENGEPVSKFDSGEQGADVDAFANQLFTEGSTGLDQLKRQAEKEAVSMKIWLTGAMDFIGYRSGSVNGSIEDSQEFVRRMQVKMSTGEGSVGGLVETAIHGLFPVRSKQSEEAFQLLVSDFYDKNPQWQRRPDEVGRDFNAESFIVDLIEFKAAFERDAVERARIKNEEPIAQAASVVESSEGMIEEEKESILRLLKRGVEKGGFAVYDTRAVGMDDIFITSNPVVSLLATNAIGRTLIVRPTGNQTSVSDSKVGLRFFPGKEGEPHVLYAPEQETSIFDQQVVLGQVLSLMARDQEASDLIASLAKGARDAIAPAFDAELVTEVIRQRMEPVRQIKAVIQKRLQLLEKPRKKGAKHSIASDEAVAYELPLSDKLKAQIESLDKFGQRKANRLLESHYVKLARDIGSNQIMEGETSGSGLVSDIGLIVNLLTDPHYKRAFDSSYTGGDVHLNHGLPEQADLALQTALQRITDYAGEQDPFYEESVSEAAMERMADMLTNPDLTLDEEIEKGEAEDQVVPVYEAFQLNDENEIEDEEESGDPASHEDAQTALITLLNPDRMKPATWEGTVPPAESFLYNHLAQIIARAKNLNQQLEPLAETKEQTTKYILDGLDSNDLAEPIFNERNRPTTKQERARSIFIGQAINLVSPRGPGGAMATAAMNYNRQRTESAAWLSRMPGVSPLIEMEAKKVIAEKLKLSPKTTSFPLVSATIPLSEGMLDSMKASLPFYQEEEDAVKRMLAKMDEDQKRLVKQLEDARAILDKPVGFGESLLQTSDLEGRTIREQMSTLVVKLARASGKALNTIASREAALFRESLDEATKGAYQGLSRTIANHFSNLHRLVRQRDQVIANQDLDLAFGIEEQITEALDGLNKTIRVLDVVASGLMNDRLVSMGLKPLKKPVIRPFTLESSKLTNEAVQAMGRRLSFSQANAENVVSRELVSRVADEFESRLNQALSVATGKKGSFGKGVDTKGTNRSVLFDFLRKAGEMDAEQVLAYIDRQIQLDEQTVSSPFTEALKMLALNTTEARRILESKALTEQQRSEREHAQALIDEANAGLEELAKLRDVKMKSDGTLFVGRFRYNTDRRGADGRLLGLNVALAITAPEMLPPSASESQKRYKDRTEAWKNSEEARKQWFVRSQALAGALSRMSEDRVDEIYKQLRGELDRSSTFDPAVMVNEAISRVEIENRIIRDRWAEGQRVADAVSKVEGDKLVRRGLSTEALALYAEPGKMLFTATKGTKQAKRLKGYLAPSNLEARKKLIGTLFDDMDGNPVALMHQDAAALLRQAFPERVTAKNSGRSMAGIVLRALSPSIGNPGFMLDPTKDTAWTGDFATTNGQKLTSAEAGKLFSAKYRKHLLDYLNQDRSTKIEEKGAATTQSLHLFSSLIEKLAHAYVNPNLSAKLKAEVAEVLRKIEHTGGFRNDDAMMELNLIPVFSKVFAELESEFVMDKLVSGLSIHDEGTSLTLMKYAHHQDARIRSRFIRDHQARETAMHLQAFLEQGLDGNTGRDGHQIAHKAAQDKIAIAAGEVGPKAMDHAIGYMLAQLDGLNDRSGMSLTQALDSWYQDITVGIKDLDRLDLAQKVQWKGRTSRFFNANHVELIRDIPLVKDLVKALKDSGAMANMGTVMTDADSPTDTDVRDASSRLVIKQLKEALLSKATPGKVDQVKAYADTIHDTLLDAYNATMVTRAMLSKAKADPKDTEGQEHDAWAHNERSPKKPTYSSVPLRRAYAANPKTGHLRVPKEGKYIEDPADVVSINDSAFFGGYGRHEDNRRESSVLRPLALNGLAAPFSILEDSLYRTNVTPNYEVLRHLLGKVENQSGVPVVGKSMMMSPEMRQSAAWRNGQGARYKVALAAVATEIENNIFNDSQIGVVQTGFAQLASFLASTFMVRSLASVQQLTNQTIPPVTFFVVKKLATGQWREAADFLAILSKTVGSMSTGAVVSPSTVFGSHEGRSEFHHRVAGFTKNISPYVHFRGLDGQDMSRNVLRHQTRHGNNKAKAYAGRMVKEYENLGEVFLNSTIGFGERIVARSIFMAELMSELRRHNGKDITVEQLLEMKAGELPIVAKQMARVKVSDMMGQSDISKKSKMFQSHSQSPVWSSLWKSLVRFSNHPATTASNMVAFLPGLRSQDQQTRREAMENIIGTIGQNSMFHFTKVHVLVPLVAYLFYSLGGDDEDEAMRKAQETADGILAREDGDNEATAFMKEITFGSKKQLFQDWKSADASRGSAWAELSSKVAMEMVQATPVVGVLAGYAPVSGMMRPVANDASSEIAAMLMDGEAAEAWYERDGIGVREYQGNAIETAANLTAPTAVVYDAGDAVKMSIEGVSAGARPFDVAAYLVSEFVPFMRDYRSARKQVLREQIKED